MDLQQALDGGDSLGHLSLLFGDLVLQGVSLLVILDLSLRLKPVIQMRNTVRGLSRDELSSPAVAYFSDAVV